MGERVFLFACPAVSHSITEICCIFNWIWRQSSRQRAAHLGLRQRALSQRI